MAMAARSVLFGVCWRGVEGRMRLSMANTSFFISKILWYFRKGELYGGPVCVMPGGAKECGSFLLGG